MNLYTQPVMLKEVSIPLKKSIKWLHSGWYSFNTYISKDKLKAIRMYEYMCEGGVKTSSADAMARAQGHEGCTHINERPKFDEFTFIV